MAEPDAKVAKLLLDAKNISGKKYMELIEHILRTDPAIYHFLHSVGLSEGDTVAIVEKTLRGQDVAYSMYAGLLDGLRQGLEHQAEKDKRAAEAISEWLGGDDEPAGA